MKALITTINEIVKYGLIPNLNIENKEKDLEKRLIKIYSFSFDIKFQFDEKDFEDYDKSLFLDIRQNVTSNFKDFGFYNALTNFADVAKPTEIMVGDAIDDLTDIISDLLEIKWRAENNSMSDALWFFELIFYAHTQQHIINLINYMTQKNGETSQGL
jgi:hypothetical protein